MLSTAKRKPGVAVVPMGALALISFLSLLLFAQCHAKGPPTWSFLCADQPKALHEAALVEKFPVWAGETLGWINADLGSFWGPAPSLCPRVAMYNACRCNWGSDNAVARGRSNSAALARLLVHGCYCRALEDG